MKPEMTDSTTIPAKSRIESIDLLRGLVMILMTLDHIRDYFGKGAILIDPTDLATTTPGLFLTRFAAHFCAPVFVFLAGTSAFLYGQFKSKPELSKFLFTRGIWLILLEVTVLNFFFNFDITFGYLGLQVIWALGISMITLAAVIYLPKQLVLFIGVVIVCGHNFLDGYVAQGDGIGAMVWYALHQQQFLEVSKSFAIAFGYPVLPWIGVMILGYVFGHVYSVDYPFSKRRKWLLTLGICCVLSFFLLRWINVYGNLKPWTIQKNEWYTVLSFFNVTKYPPSLDYLLITLGPAFIFLSFIESIKNRVTDFLLTFGRVPLFYYVLHLLFIHALAIFVLMITNAKWQMMILTKEVDPALEFYGYPLWTVYLIWIGTVVSLFPLTRLYMKYKAKHNEKWWLSYL